MRMLQRSLMFTFAFGVLAPALLAAQVTVFPEGSRRGWIGISYEADYQRTQRDARQIVRVTSVADASPAQTAGLQAGDTLVSINGLPASEQLLGSLSYSLGPGETVQLRVRRDGRERDVAVVMGERPANVALRPAGQGRTITIDFDSVFGMARNWLDSARIHLDTLRLPRIMIEMPEGRRVITGDSIRQMWRDSMFVRFDTIAPAHFHWRAARGDTLLRAELDSVVRRLRTVRGERDSSRAALRRDWPDFAIHADSAAVWLRRMPAMQPGARTAFVFGARAVAGAEVTDIEPGMESYFGTGDGVLVLRVGDGTPALRAGLRAGDVILSVNGRATPDVAALRRSVGEVPRAEPIRLELLRERRSMVVEMPRE